MEKIIEKAKQLVEKYHEGQKRESRDIPYFTHAAGVAKMVSELTEDPEVIAAAYLHDVIEGIWEFPGKWDLEAARKEIASLGSNVLRYVEALSHDNKKEDYQDYIRRLAKDKKLRIIKICDMIYNVTESPNEEQRERYRKGLITLSN